MLFIIAILAGIVPMVIYALFIYWLDRYEREPLGLVVVLFLWGFVPAAILALISQVVLGLPLMLLDSPDFVNQVEGIIIAPITEELLKGFAVFVVYLLFRHEFDDIFDGILYGSMVGFGFAAVENIFYFLAGTSALGMLIFFRVFLFGFNHALYTGLTGLGFGVARHARRAFIRFLAPTLGLLGAMSVHGLHNLGMTFAGTSDVAALLCIPAALVDWLGAVFLLSLLVASLWRQKRWLERYLLLEVQRGVLQIEQYQVVCSLFSRRRARLAALLAGDFARWSHYGRFFEACSELAFRSQRLERTGDQGLEAHVETLRTKVVTLARDAAF